MKDIESHTNLEAASQEILAVLEAEVDQLMVVVTGVSRVGKTTLLRHVERNYSKLHPGTVIRFDVPPKGSPIFTFKQFLIRYLDTLGDPFDRSYRRPNLEGYSVERLQTMLLKRINQSGVKLVLLDESNVFMEMRGSDGQRRENISFIKDLVNQTQARHVFAGTRRLNEFVDLDIQVQNRAHLVRLAPYRIDVKDELKTFLQMFRYFSSQIKTKVSSEITESPAVIFDETNGCVGALSDILFKIEKICLSYKLESITPEILKRYGYHDTEGRRKTEIDDYYWPPQADTGPTKAQSMKRSSKANKKRSSCGRRKKPEDPVG